MDQRRTVQKVTEPWMETAGRQVCAAHLGASALCRCPARSMAYRSGMPTGLQIAQTATIPGHRPPGARSLALPDATVVPAAPTPTAGPAVPPTSAPVAEVSTTVPEPTVPPAPLPIPAPTTAPAPQPAPTGDLFAQLRALLVAGVADGRAGADGKELIKKFDEGQAAFVSGDLQKTAEKLRELRQKVQEKTREGKLEANFSQQALGLIDAIANTYGLNVASDDNGKDDKGKDDKGKDDKGKDK